MISIDANGIPLCLEEEHVGSFSPLFSLLEDESDLEMETANFLQALCLRAEEKIAAAGGCPAEQLDLDCPSTSAETNMLPRLRHDN